MALERRQFIGLTPQEASTFDGLDREITVDTTNGTLRVHTEDSPHGNRLAKYSELDAVNSLMLSEFDSVRGQINDVDDELSSGLSAETSARENADASLSSSIGTNTTAIDGLATRVTAVETGLSGKQATLVSGTNIKTINSTSLLGSEDITVQPTLVSGTNIKTINNLSLLGSGNIEIQGGGGGSSNTQIYRVPCSYYYSSTIRAQWYSTSSESSSFSSQFKYYMDYPLEEIAEAQSVDVSLGTYQYFPVVLFSPADAVGQDFATFCELYKPIDKWHLKIYCNSSTMTTSGFTTLLIKTENAASNYAMPGVTNAHRKSYSQVYTDSLPASPDANTLYFIPES